MSKLNEVRELIEWGIYDKEIEEPTPLTEKVVLVAEVKTLFYDDLLSRGFHLEIIHLAWEFAIDSCGGEEALNSSFLYTVLNNIEKIENCINLILRKITI